MEILAYSVALLILVAGAATFISSDDKEGVRIGIFLGILAAILYSTIVIDVSPDELGVGHVPSKVEDLEKRLDTGVEYQLVESVVADIGLILIVKDTSSSDLRVINVKEAPPEYFTLLDDGRPIATSGPATLTDK